MKRKQNKIQCGVLVGVHKEEEVNLFQKSRWFCRNTRPNPIWMLILTFSKLQEEMKKWKMNQLLKNSKEQKKL